MNNREADGGGSVETDGCSLVSSVKHSTSVNTFERLPKYKGFRVRFSDAPLENVSPSAPHFSKSNKKPQDSFSWPFWRNSCRFLRRPLQQRSTAPQASGTREVAQAHAG